MFKSMEYFFGAPYLRKYLVVFFLKSANFQRLLLSLQSYIIEKARVLVILIHYGLETLLFSIDIFENLKQKYILGDMVH